jgi:hypothetical protein
MILDCFGEEKVLRKDEDGKQEEGETPTSGKPSTEWFPSFIRKLLKAKVSSRDIFSSYPLSLSDTAEAAFLNGTRRIVMISPTAESKAPIKNGS